ncbi:hypothetical protein ACTSKR_16310 [Chitinibacteraceae bacterium HSL-7]
MNLLSLELPLRDDKLIAVVKTDRSELRSWLVALPYSDALAAGRQMLDALASCNRVTLDVDERLGLLDEYQSALEVLSGGLNELYRNAGFPLAGQPRQAALLARSLWLELATGFKVAIVDKQEKRFGFGSSRALPPLIHRALAVYYRLYQTTSQVLMPAPDGMWMSCHQLFRFAAEQRVLEENCGQPDGPTLGALYKRLLLLSLADPTRFAPNELTRVIDAIDTYAPYAHFQPVDRELKTAGFFLVRLDTDEPPRFIGARSTEEYRGMALLLDTTDLDSKLERVLIKLEAKAPKTHDRAKVLSWLETMRRLRKQWAIAPKRVFQRIRSNAVIDAVHGLADTARVLRGEVLPPVRWRVLNESPGGYALSARDMPPRALHAGDLVALRAYEENPWMVAAVRWLAQNEDGSLEMGVQIISASALPARCDLDGLPTDVLLLPEVGALKQPALIAAPKSLYTPLRLFEFSTAEGLRRLRAGKLAEQQVSFDLFEYLDD